LIETSYSAISGKFCELDDKQLKWEMIKMALRGLIIRCAKRKARKSRENLESLEQRLAETKAFINNCNEGGDNLETQLTLQEQLKKELQYLYEKKGEGAMFRPKLRWTEQGEKPTRYFFFHFRYVTDKILFTLQVYFARRRSFQFSGYFSYF